MRLTVLICWVFSCGISFGQSKTLPPEVVSFIQKRIEAEMNPSIVVGIIDKDGPEYYSFGRKKKGGKKVNEHTIYEIGSITKVFTSTLLADMAVKGELCIDDPIEKFLPPDVHVPTFEDGHITLGHLSNHTSSLPRLPNNLHPVNPSNPYADYSVEQLYDFISGYRLDRQIGSQYEYSNLAVGLLGHILALHANTSYEQLILTRIAKPLDMNETRISLSTKMKKNLARGHRDGIVVFNWDLPTIAGAGAIRSSAADMLKFLAANLDFFEHPLQQAMDLTHIPRHDISGTDQIGLGWHITKSSAGDIIWHNGGTGGYRTFAGFNKEKGVGVVVFTNSTESVDAIGFHLLDPDETLPNVLPHVSIQLREIIDHDGVAGLDEKFEKIKTSELGKYDFSELGINALGYYYLNRKQYNEAIAVFLINIKEYPKSANVYDSYAEALMEKGDTALAIINYKKSLEINPGNENAVKMLAKMGQTIEVTVPQIDTVILESYVGVYELVQGFEISILREGNGLTAQATGQSAFPIYPKSENEFYYKVVDARIVFNKDKEGKTESLTLFQNGREVVGRRKP